MKRQSFLNKMRKAVNQSIKHPGYPTCHLLGEVKERETEYGFYYIETPHIRVMYGEVMSPTEFLNDKSSWIGFEEYKILASLRPTLLLLFKEYCLSTLLYEEFNDDQDQRTGLSHLL